MAVLVIGLVGVEGRPNPGPNGRTSGNGVPVHEDGDEHVNEIIFNRLDLTIKNLIDENLNEGFDLIRWKPAVDLRKRK